MIAPPPEHYITKKNAKEWAQRSATVRRLHAEAKQLRIEADAAKEALAAYSAVDYRGERLVRVRKQLNNIDKSIDVAILKGDAKQIKELADAQMRLNEQERQLANRPMPGTERPSNRKQKSSDPQPITYPETEPQYMVLHDPFSEVVFPRESNPPVNDPNEPNG